MIYDHPQCQAEGVSKDVNTWVEVSGPLDSEDKTKVRIRYHYLMCKRSHGSETLKGFISGVLCRQDHMLQYRSNNFWFST